MKWKFINISNIYLEMYRSFYLSTHFMFSFVYDNCVSKSHEMKIIIKWLSRNIYPDVPFSKSLRAIRNENLSFVDCLSCSTKISHFFHNSVISIRNYIAFEPATASFLRTCYSFLKKSNKLNSDLRSIMSEDTAWSIRTSALMLLKYKINEQNNVIKSSCRKISV
jgi:hypothetical protein